MYGEAEAEFSDFCQIPCVSPCGHAKNGLCALTCVREAAVLAENPDCPFFTPHSDSNFTKR
ncbi:MAG: hypothetical protein LBU36_01100 [Clostridiales bacterium]|jgi:hypothetical protein|nr:hypothetical protein [Clostridiales bacterium]